MQDRLTVVDPKEFASTAARHIAQALAGRLAESASCTLALTGGTTARPVYECLASGSDIPIQWSDVTFFFGDERAVPPDDVRSNFRMARDTLLSRIPIEPDQVHRMEAEQPDLDHAARNYEHVLPTALDLLLLGVGWDGHVCSLFPGAASLAESTRRVTTAFGGDPRLARLTLTPPAIRAARQRIIFAAGTRKARAIAEAIEGPYQPERCPAQLARDGHWIVDREAAAALTTAP